MRTIVISLVFILTATASFGLGWYMKKPEKLPLEEPVVVNEQERIADSIVNAKYPDYQVYGMHQEKDRQRQIIDHQYKFRFSIVGGCTADDETRASAEKQNKITNKIMTARYGKNWLDKFENSVDSLYTLDSLAIEIARSDERIEKIETSVKKYNTHVDSEYYCNQTPDDNIRIVTLTAQSPVNGETRYMNQFRAAVDMKRRKVVNLDAIPY